MGRVRRALLALAVLAVVAVGVYWFALRDSSTAPAQAEPLHAVAQIGEGKRVILVASEGSLMGAASTESQASGKAEGKAAGKTAASKTAAGGKSQAESHLPVLPLKSRPKGDRVKGRVLEQVKVLAAAPRALTPYIAATS